MALAPCVVRQTPASAPEIKRLVEQLWQELGIFYPEFQATSPNEIVGPGSGFVVAFVDDEAVGCGAWRRFAAEEPAVAEIKRMFVAPAARGLGISRAILRELETCAKKDCYSTVRLETGLRQPTALRLYQTAGYDRIAPYGRYRDDPLSVCFEKKL